MSRYDGLIIPRSYSEYINKTDAATLLQALQLSGVMDNVPTANSNHPVKSSGVYNAIGEIISNPNIANCNDMFIKGKIAVYCANRTEVTNLPNINHDWYIIAQCNPTSWSSNNYVTQIATSGGYLNSNDMYIRHGYLSGTTIVWTSWEKVITPKVKEVTGTTSVNGNLQLNLAGATNVVIAVQTSNSQGSNNDMIAIPYKLGDGTPDTSPTGNGRWGVHCIASNGSNTVQVNTNVYLTVFYYER